MITILMLRCLRVLKEMHLRFFSDLCYIYIAKRTQGIDSSWILLGFFFKYFFKISSRHVLGTSSRYLGRYFGRQIQQLLRNQLMFAGRAKPHFVFENILLLTRRNFSLNHAYWQTSATICIFWKRNNDHIINKTHFWDLKAIHASNNFSYQELVRKKWIIKILMLNLQILNNNRGL